MHLTNDKIMSNGLELKCGALPSTYLTQPLMLQLLWHQTKRQGQAEDRFSFK